MSHEQKDERPTSDAYGLTPAQPRPKRGARIFTVFIRALMCLVLAVLCLITSVLVHLNTALALDVACSLGRELGSEAIAGSMDFQCVDIDFQLPLSVVATVEAIELFDADGEHVVDAELMMASAALMPLFDGELLLSDVVIRAPRVSLATDDGGELRIAQAFLPTGPADPNPEPSTFVMRIAGAITSASVRNVPGIDAQLDDLTLGLSVDVEGGSVEIHASQREVARVMLNGDAYGELTGLAYDFGLRDGGSMDAALRLAAPDGHLQVSASMPWIDDTLGALVGRADGVLTNAMLSPFIGQDLLGGPTEIALAVHSAEGETPSAEPSPFGAFMAEGELRTPGGDVALEASVELAGPLRAALAIRSSRLELETALAQELGVTGATRFDLDLTASEGDTGWDIGVRGDDIAYDTWEVQ
ncbi:MAG: hypothetical protein ACI9KE_006017, partial [Polyangiales bacterium]